MYCLDPPLSEPPEGNVFCVLKRKTFSVSRKDCCAIIDASYDNYLF